MRCSCCVLKLILIWTAWSTIEAQSVTSFGFVSTANQPTLVRNGDAVSLGGSVRLINGTVLAQSGVRGGSLFFHQPVRLDSGFDTTFDFRIDPSPALGTLFPGHGFAFVVHSDPTGVGFLKTTTGPGLGYGGGIETLAIEFDNALDATGDTGTMEISVHTNGPAAVTEDEAFSIGRAQSSVNFADGVLHTARILVQNSMLQVFLDGILELTTAYSPVLGGVFIGGAGVPGIALLNGTEAFVGFTASATTNLGGVFSIQEPRILNWSFTAVAQLDPCFTGNVSGTLGGVVDILRVNGSAGDVFRTVTLSQHAALAFSLGQPP
ncbi:MAG: hypothetical protein KDB53_03750, partial [Planctomycetes bacterium]|nr:hypothetical protein [Planctomycetota bacterium]